MNGTSTASVGAISGPSTIQNPVAIVNPLIHRAAFSRVHDGTKVLDDVVPLSFEGDIKRETPS